MRGTSGSGKTWVMRRLMERMNGWDSRYREGRRRALYHENHQAIVLGSYEAAVCGGCDTIGSAKAVYDLIQELTPVAKGRVILCEGLLLSEDTLWSKQIPDLRVIYLVTPLAICLERIKSRRLAAGNDKELNPENTSRRVSVIARSKVKLESAGVFCRSYSAGRAPGVILSWVHESTLAD